MASRTRAFAFSRASSTRWAVTIVLVDSVAGEGVRALRAVQHVALSLTSKLASRLLGEVHLAEEGLKAGVGAEGVEGKPSVDKSQDTVAFLGGLFSPGDGVIVVA